MVVILSAAKNPVPWIIHEEKNGFLGRKLPRNDKMKAKQRSRSGSHTKLQLKSFDFNWSGTVLRTLPFCACDTKSVSCELQRAFGAIKCYFKHFNGVQYQPFAFLWRAGEPGPYGGCGVRGRPMTAPTGVSLRDQAADWSWQSASLVIHFQCFQMAI